MPGLRRVDPASTATRMLCLAGVVAVALSCAACERADLPITAGRKRGIKIENVRAGDGPPAGAGSQVWVHYTGYLPDGDVFMDTRRNHKPHVWIIGDGSVIDGMDRAVTGMRKGAKRKVVIPPEMHWGNGGYGGVIPKDAWLTFDIEMVSVQ
ncbi:MAG: FKBP-type peptidyl-prolyl cis-trans isomerase [Phycisphaerales bacterium]